jgi:hypothetical protein
MRTFKWINQNKYFLFYNRVHSEGEVLIYWISYSANVAGLLKKHVKEFFKMGSKFKTLDDMKELANLLSFELMKIDQIDLAEEIISFSYNTFTTSSEYLGELRFVLERILCEVNNPNFTQTDTIKDAVIEINKAFK